jgi:hypothetical protein
MTQWVEQAVHIQKVFGLDRDRYHWSRKWSEQQISVSVRVNSHLETGGEKLLKRHIIYTYYNNKKQSSSSESDTCLAGQIISRI